MAKQLKDDDIAVIVARAIARSEDFSSGKLATERKEVVKYYRGEAPPPMHKGDSSYVSRDVYESVDTMRSQILETFSAHQRIVYWEPEKEDSVEAAQQATEYCRHVFFKENHGDEIMYTALSDGLMNRFTVAKVYYETVEDQIDYEFEDLDEDQLVDFVSGLEDYEVKNSDTDGLAAGIYSGELTEIKKRKKICVEIIKPEDFLIWGQSTSIRDARACAHRTRKTKADLLKAGFKKKVIEDLSFETRAYADEEVAHRFRPVGGFLGDNDILDESEAEIEVFEAYLKLDVEGTGRSRLWKVTYAGNKVLDKEPVRIAPFAPFVPLPTAHTFFGENYASQAIPTQKARTTLQRQIINHAVKTNTQRKYVQTGVLPNPAELLDNRHGGIVNVRRIDGIIPEPQAPLNPYVFNMIAMLDEDREETSGISKLSQGLNKDALSKQNSEGMVDQLIQVSQIRQKIIARQFGKFLAEVWYLIYHTAVDYIDEAEYVSVTGNYVPVNPTEWHDRKAATVELALGYGEREKEGQKFVMMDQMFMSDPQLQVAYTPDKRWRVLSQATERMGIANLATYLTPPDQIPPQEPSEMEKLAVEQARAQVEYTKAQAAAMMGKIETDKIKAQADLLRAQSEARVKMLDHDLEEREFQHEQVIDHKELELAEKAQETKGIFAAEG